MQADSLCQDVKLAAIRVNNAEAAKHGRHQVRRSIRLGKQVDESCMDEAIKRHEGTLATLRQAWKDLDACMELARGTCTPKDIAEALMS